MRDNDDIADHENAHQHPAGGAHLSGRSPELRLTAGGVIGWDHTESAQEHLLGELRALIANGDRRICDVGGGANPVFSERKIERLGLEYVVLDASEHELEKAPSSYERLSGDIMDGELISQMVAERGAFDVVVSRFTAEHVPDGRLFHEHVFSMLRPGGHAVHLFPTLYSPPFVLNHVLPSALSERLLSGAVHGDRSAQGRHPKFRTYYSWCRGPSRRQLARLRSVGFSIERYVGFFGHSYYRRVKPLERAHLAATELLLEHPLASMTSFALIVLRRD